MKATEVNKEVVLQHVKFPGTGQTDPKEEGRGPACFGWQPKAASNAGQSWMKSGEVGPARRYQS